jgi:hypothetical protein
MFSIWVLASPAVHESSSSRQVNARLDGRSGQLFGVASPGRLDVEPIQLLKIGIFVSEAGKVYNSCHRAPGGSWVAGIPTR